jgi:hypothetical protein
MTTKLLIGAAVIVIAPLTFITKHITNKVENTHSTQFLLNTHSSLLKEKDTSVVFPKPSQLAPAILVKQNPKDTGSVPLAISKANIRVDVVGNIVTTKMELTFYNATNRILEGEFVCPLGEGQSMSYFAFDVNGELREGVVVEKAKARQVFESVVRRNVDPGLLEWTKGNNFRSRIYPIPANGYKTIVVGFQQELISNRSSYIYYQPLLFKNKLQTFDVAVEVQKQNIAPILYGQEKVNLTFSNWTDVWKASAHFENYIADKPIAFEVPINSTKNNVITQAINANASYFYVNLTPDKYIVNKPLPAKIAVLWDNSQSAAKRDTATEFKLLDVYFSKLKNISIELVMFSNVINKTITYDVVNGNWKALKQELQRTIYDGGTQLGSINLKSYQADEYLLFSDGLSNFGTSDLIFSNKPVYCITSFQQTDYSKLKYIAQKSGGSVINLSTTETHEAIKQLSFATYQFLSANFDSTAVSEIYPSIPTPILNGFSMAGILKSNQTELVLNYGIAGTILYQEKINLRKDNNLSTDLIGKLWAQKKINELDINYSKNTKEITRLGKAFSLVTRNTSLLILDDINDYVQYKIIPPTKQLQTTYFTAIKNEERLANTNKQEHLNKVSTDFDELINWYSQDYKSDCMTYDKSKTNNQEGYGSGSGVELDETVSQMDLTPTVMETVQFSPPVIKDDAVESFESDAVTVSYNSSLSSNIVGRIGFKEKDKNSSSNELTSSIDLKEWNPNTPYLKALQATDHLYLYAKYLELKKQYSATPTFYLDVATYFTKQNLKPLALRILSNIAELETENHQLLRILGHRLLQLNETELAISTFQEVLIIREEEPQSYRDLGLAFAQNKNYQQAVDYLCKVVNRPWDNRFPGIETIAINEINNVIAKSTTVLNLDSLDKRFIKKLPVDVRIVINWDSDNCDMDLWVTDPCKEKCFYQNKITRGGGRISNDYTGGYGPEEFLIKHSAQGSYFVQVNYYGTRQQTIYGPTTVQAELYTNYGKPNEQKKEITLQLMDNKEVIDIGNLVFTK